MANERTSRDLGINLRALGLSPRQLSGMTDEQVAEAMRTAARKLYRLAKKLEGGK